MTSKCSSEMKSHMSLILNQNKKWLSLVRKAFQKWEAES